MNKPNHRPWPGWTTAVVGAMVLWCALLVALRVQHSGHITYRFLLWNLALAGVPYVLGKAMRRADAAGWPGLLVAGLGAGWLLFFPNAPYMLTDLLHLGPKPGVPLWYDLALLLSCGGTALALGYLSLLDVHAVLLRRVGWGLSWLVVVATQFLSGFGIYLGRYQRWNSWDVATRPTVLVADLLDRFVHPLAHPRTWGVTVLFGVVLTLGYALLRVVLARKEAA